MPLLPAGLRPAEAIYLLTFAAFLVGAVGASLACNWALVEELRLSYHDPAYAALKGVLDTPEKIFCFVWTKTPQTGMWGYNPISVPVFAWNLNPQRL